MDLLATRIRTYFRNHTPLSDTHARCSGVLPVQAFSSCRPIVMQGHAGPVFNHSSALPGVGPSTGREELHSRRHPLFQIWQLRKMPPPLVAGWRVSRDVQYLEQRWTSPFPEVPVLAARFVYIRAFASASHRSNKRWRTERQQSEYKGDCAMCPALALDTLMGS